MTSLTIPIVNPATRQWPPAEAFRQAGYSCLVAERYRVARWHFTVGLRLMVASGAARN